LCHRNDYRYGALLITQVDEKVCEQVVWCTPKLQYPFDHAGTYHFPSIVKGMYFEKLDGTNVVAYHYMCDGRDCVSFKTRLTPIIVDGRYGAFIAMLRELLESQPWINTVISQNPAYNLSFEMWGSRNPVMITYPEPLALTLLFGVHRESHAVTPCTALESSPGVRIPREYVLTSNDAERTYNEYRAAMSIRNQGENLTVEGMVLYAYTVESRWVMFKCKPEEIEKVHWCTGGIPHAALWTTALNSFEAADTGFEQFLALLHEEYTDSQIGKSEARIAKIYAEATAHIQFASRVNAVWTAAKQAGLDITKDKAETMRFMSGHFDRKEMRRVGSAVLKQAGLL
jgi:hypothetical protein